MSHRFERLHGVAKSIDPSYTIKMRHIFYPTLKLKLMKDYQSIEKFILEGFHHDEHSILEKTGIFTFISKTYGSPEFGAEECFIGVIDFGHGIVCKGNKTFFPASWSQEKVIEVILQAAENKIKMIEDLGLQKVFECQGPNNMLIDIVIDENNIISSAYPSLKNFVGV
jgi:hypothetical protein